jgi:hypothetical protein
MVRQAHHDISNVYRSEPVEDLYAQLMVRQTANDKLIISNNEF